VRPSRCVASTKNYEWWWRYPMRLCIPVRWGDGTLGSQQQLYTAVCDKSINIRALEWQSWGSHDGSLAHDLLALPASSIVACLRRSHSRHLMAFWRCANRWLVAWMASTFLEEITQVWEYLDNASLRRSPGTLVYLGQWPKVKFQARWPDNLSYLWSWSNWVFSWEGVEFLMSLTSSLIIENKTCKPGRLSKCCETWKKKKVAAELDLFTKSPENIIIAPFHKEIHHLCHKKDTGEHSVKATQVPRK
jgi:hypothetical protein